MESTNSLVMESEYLKKGKGRLFHVTRYFSTYKIRTPLIRTFSNYCIYPKLRMRGVTIVTLPSGVGPT